jgi:hypothetical protein
MPTTGSGRISDKAKELHSLLEREGGKEGRRREEGVGGGQGEEREEGGGRAEGGDGKGSTWQSLVYQHSKYTLSKRP